MKKERRQLRFGVFLLKKKEFADFKKKGRRTRERKREERVSDKNKEKKSEY